MTFFQKWHALYLFIILLACNTPNSDTPIENIDEASTKVIIDNLNTSSDATTALNETKGDVFLEEDIDTQYINNVKKRIANSKVAKTYKNDCAAILKKYQTIAKKYIATGDEKILDEILDWSNDPVFLSCKKQKSYNTAFNEVDELLD